jgi:FlaA1/EpsC-like NDP-sugar epimerase
LQPGRDIRIEFSGLRPGEKLHEELSRIDEALAPTTHAKISSFASPSGSDRRQMTEQMRELSRIVDQEDVRQLIRLLQTLVPDYSPDARLLESSVSRATSPDAARGNPLALR